jgi:histidinol-phosphate aminotransferase
MAGLRLGMLFASSEIIAWLNKIKPPYNINQLTQIEALKRLENLDEVQNQIKTILVERIRLETKLIQFDEVEKVYNSDSNFILLKVKSADDVYNYLIENKIIVRNRSKQPLCDNCIRITVGTKKENDFLLKKLKEFSIK